MQLVAIVDQGRLETREALKDAIDQCTMLGFRFTDDDLDLDRDFAELALAESMQDKFPDELASLTVPMKLEIWKTMSRLGIEGCRQMYVSTSASGTAIITFEPEEGDLIGPILLNCRMSPPARIAEHERQRVQSAQKKLAAATVPIDLKAPDRHIPIMERPRVQGKIPDAYGRLPGDNGYNTSYPPGQDLISKMQAATTVANVNVPYADPAQDITSRQGCTHLSDQYGRKPGHPKYMNPFPPGHPSLIQSRNPVKENRAKPTPGDPAVHSRLDTGRNYMAGLTRAIAEARLAQHVGIYTPNLYTYAENNPVTLIDPSGLDVSIGPVPPGTSCGGQDATTGCNFTKGQPYTLICNTPCDAPCTDAHEGQHRHDISSCCSKASNCYNAARSSAGRQRCLILWGVWVNAERASTECQAYRSGRLCRQHMAKCHDCYGAGAGSACCTDIQKGIDRDDRDIARNCSGVGWPRLPQPKCPF